MISMYFFYLISSEMTFSSGLEGADFNADSIFLQLPDGVFGVGSTLTSPSNSRRKSSVSFALPDSLSNSGRRRSSASLCDLSPKSPQDYGFRGELEDHEVVTKWIMRDITPGIAYTFMRLSSGSFSDAVYGVYQDTLCYVVKFLKKEPLSRRKRREWEARLSPFLDNTDMCVSAGSSFSPNSPVAQDIKNENERRVSLSQKQAALDIKRNSILSLPIDVIRHFDELLQDGKDAFESQSFLAVILPEKMYHFDDEEGGLIVEVSKAAKGISLEDFIARNKARDQVEGDQQEKNQSEIVKVMLDQFGEKLAMFHAETHYIHGDLSARNVFVAVEEGSESDMYFSLIDTHTMSNTLDSLPKFRANGLVPGHGQRRVGQSMFMEDIKQFVNSLLLLPLVNIIDSCVAREYGQIFFEGYSRGYSVILKKQTHLALAEFRMNFEQLLEKDLEITREDGVV